MKGIAVLVTTAAFCLSLALLHSTWAQVGLPFPGPGWKTAGGAAGYTLKQHQENEGAGIVATLTSTFASTTAGNMVSVELFYCQSGSCAGTSNPIAISDSNGSCPILAQAGGTTGIYALVALCPNIGGGSDTVTATWTGGNADFTSLFIQEWQGAVTASPGDQPNSSTITCAASPYNVSTAGNVALTNELILSINYSGGGPNTAQQTLIDHDSSGNIIVEYQIGTTATTYTNGITSAVSGQCRAAITGVKHP